jgi:O-methyltransferase
VPLVPLKALTQVDHDVLVVAADDDKEELLLESLPFIQGTPRIIVAGYGHLAFRDPVFMTNWHSSWCRA